MESLVGLVTIGLSSTVGIAGSFLVLWVVINVAGSGGRG